MNAQAVAERPAEVDRFLHDGPLQMLEYVAAGGYGEVPDVAHLRIVAAAAADELRAFLDGRSGQPGDLVTALDGAVVDAQLLAPQLDVRLVAGAIERQPDADTIGELVAAVREALTNVRRHSGARQVTVRCAVQEHVVTVGVQDDGIGFVPGPGSAGRGIRGSVIRRMRDLGGRALISSRPGEGTRVQLVLDLRERAA